MRRRRSDSGHHWRDHVGANRGVQIVAGAFAICLVTQCGASSQRATPATAPSTTGSTTTAVPATTTVPVSTDRRIADASMAADGDIGEGWTLRPNDEPWLLDAAAAAAIPSCAPFLDIVFESERRPATVASAMFAKGFSGRTVAYVVVLPDEARATAMIDAVASPEFETCMLDYLSRPTPEDGGQHTSKHLDWPALDLAGDQSVLLGTTETYVGAYGDPAEYPAPWAFFRSGRVVGMLAPPYGSGDFTDAELVAAVGRAVDRMQAAQSGT